MVGPGLGPLEEVVGGQDLRSGGRGGVHRLANRSEISTVGVPPLPRPYVPRGSARSRHHSRLFGFPPVLISGCLLTQVRLFPHSSPTVGSLSDPSTQTLRRTLLT